MSNCGLSRNNLLMKSAPLPSALSAIALTDDWCRSATDNCGQSSRRGHRAADRTSTSRDLPWLYDASATAQPSTTFAGHQQSLCVRRRSPREITHLYQRLSRATRDVEKIERGQTEDPEMVKRLTRSRRSGIASAGSMSTCGNGEVLPQSELRHEIDVLPSRSRAFRVLRQRGHGAQPRSAVPVSLQHTVESACSLPKEFRCPW